MTVPKYIIISPVRNEAAHLPITIESVARQTILPALWVIVNDGSTDNSMEVLDAAGKTYPWIKPIQRENRGFRKSGGG